MAKSHQIHNYQSNFCCELWMGLAIEINPHVRKDSLNVNEFKFDMLKQIKNLDFPKMEIIPHDIKIKTYFFNK